jgi:hypothetical protein
MSMIDMFTGSSISQLQGIFIVAGKDQYRDIGTPGYRKPRALSNKAGRNYNI